MNNKSEIGYVVKKSFILGVYYISPSPTHDRKQRGTPMDVFYSILQTALTGSYIRRLSFLYTQEKIGCFRNKEIHMCCVNRL
jgi:hypothetical protein